MNQKLICSLALLVLAACGGSDPVVDGSIGDGGVMTDAIAETDGSVPASCRVSTECNDSNPCTWDQCAYDGFGRSIGCRNEVTPGACADYKLVAGSAWYGCGVDVEGSVYCWQSGYEETFWPRAQVVGIPPIKRLAIGEGGMTTGYVVRGESLIDIQGAQPESWVCGLDELGSVWCWYPNPSTPCPSLTMPVHVQGITGARDIAIATAAYSEAVYIVDAIGRLYWAPLDSSCNPTPVATEVILLDPTLTLSQIDAWHTPFGNEVGLGLTEDGRLTYFSPYHVNIAGTTTSLPPLKSVAAGDWTESYDTSGSGYFPIASLLDTENRLWTRYASNDLHASIVFERIELSGFTTCGLRSDGTLACFGGSFPNYIPSSDFLPLLPPEDSMVEIAGVLNPDDFSVVAGQLCIAVDSRIRCWSIADGLEEFPLPWNL